jgi:hypothetical protein
MAGPTICEIVIESDLLIERSKEHIRELRKSLEETGRVIDKFRAVLSHPAPDANPSQISQ